MSVSAASIPFWLLTSSLGGLILITLLIRGDALWRVAVMGISLVTLPWAWGMAVILGMDDPDMVFEIGRLAIGPLVFVGPALLFLLLAISGTLEKHRNLVVAFAALGALVCILTWRSELVVAGSWQTPWGLQLPRGGPLAPLHGGVILSSLAAGLVISLRSIRRTRSPIPTHRIAIVALLVGLAIVECLLLGYEIGVYPLSVIPAESAAVIAILALTRHNAAHSRGFDRASFYELLVVIGILPLVVAIGWSTSRLPRGGAIVAAVTIAPLFAAVHTLVILLRDYLARQKLDLNEESMQHVDDYNDDSQHVNDETALAGALRDTLERAISLSPSILLVSEDQQVLRIIRPASSDDGDRATRPSPDNDRKAPADPDPTPDHVEIDHVEIARELRDWLVTQRQPLVYAELTTRRLGDIREKVEALFDDLSVDVLVPLVDRDVLVGAIASNTGGATLDELEFEVMGEVARSTARALTYIGLIREAQARVEIAKELEVAAAVQHARRPGEVRRRYGTCQVIAHYRPAAQFGGDWWMTHELPDGRVLVVIGDVAGRGMPAALVSSTVSGACQTAQAMLGMSCEVLSLLELLNDAVLAVGGEDYPMSCFVALIDLDNGIASFANAGHPFPYRCRQVGEDNNAQLQTLISRGDRLGARAPELRASTIEIEEGDILVFYSDALVDARNSDGRRYGDRRLQTVLRRFVHAAGDRACEVIIADALAYCGKEPIADDLTLVVLRMDRERPTTG